MKLFYNQLLSNDTAKLMYCNQVFTNDRATRWTQIKSLLTAHVKQESDFSQDLKLNKYNLCYQGATMSSSIQNYIVSNQIHSTGSSGSLDFV